MSVCLWDMQCVKVMCEASLLIKLFQISKLQYVESYALLTAKTIEKLYDIKY